jgi:EAL domain-containing protein (putative c-di-GMP-specific phosphodiesterase class I)
VQGVGQRADSTAIATAIVSLSRALGLRSVAEGIETTLQLDELRAVGCEMGQGFLFGAAQPAAAYGDDPTCSVPTWGLLGASQEPLRTA